jgi:hypothetical protein
MTLVALISNPRSTGNKALLPAVRDYCARNPDIFHYEVEEVHQIADALRAIALVKPRVLVINGGDGTVQATLTELYHGSPFGKTPPPVAVLPNGKTNLIALDLGASGKPIPTLDRIVEIALGVFISIVMIVTYHKINEYGEDVGALGLVDPIIALWLPFALFSLLIGWMYYQVAFVPGGQPIGALEKMFAKSGAAIRGLFSFGRKRSFQE